MGMFSRSFCTCSGDAARCDHCVACERIECRLRADESEIAGLNGRFPGETYLALDALSARAFLTRDWSTYNAAMREAMEAALAERVLELREREVTDDSALVAMLHRVAA